MIATLGSAQSNPKGDNALILTSGVGLRVTPVPLGGYVQTHDLPRVVNSDQNISGLALNLGMLYYLAKHHLAFELSTSCRNDHLEFFDGNKIQDKQIFTSDFHCTLNKFFPLRKNLLRAGFGYSILNNGSNFSFTYKEVNSMGDTILSRMSGNFRFSTFNLNAGYQWKQVTFELVNRFCLDLTYAYGEYFYIPELRITYNLRLKNEKVFR
jgi:hypothetical protein